MSFSVGNSFMLLPCWDPMLGAQSDPGDSKVNRKRRRDTFENRSMRGGGGSGSRVGTCLGLEEASYRCDVELGLKEWAFA